MSLHTYYTIILPNFSIFYIIFFNTLHILMSSKKRQLNS
nr:MAG TPA: hypothetical protein [Caudoviricetes sp.]